MKSRLARGPATGAEASIVAAFHGESFLLVDSPKGWELPGGRIEPGETPGEAAAREFDEETGGSVGRLRYVCRGGTNAECAIYACELDEPPPGGRLFSSLPERLKYPRGETLEFLGAAWRARADYDEIAGYFDSVRGASSPSAMVWLEKCAEILEASGGTAVADIGCGSGKYALGLSRIGACVVGLDLSRGMLEKARGNDLGGEVAWVGGDAQAMPLRGSTFDSALLFLAIHHMPLWRWALRECARIISPGGRLLVVTTSRARIRRHIIRFFPGAVGIDLGRFQSLTEIKAGMASAGFGGLRCDRVLATREPTSVEEVVDRFKKRHISTLALVPGAEFVPRLEIFESRLRRRYEKAVPDETELCFLSGILPNL